MSLELESVYGVPINEMRAETNPDNRGDGALFSEDGKYRYLLRRSWSPPGEKTIAWVMLNPSTADAMQDDATIRRCISFSKAWGYDSLTVVNLYAYRHHNPKRLLEQDDPVGKWNPTIIRAVLNAPDTREVVFAWGAWWGNLHITKRPPGSTWKASRRTPD